MEVCEIRNFKRMPPSLIKRLEWRAVQPTKFELEIFLNIKRQLTGIRIGAGIAWCRAVACPINRSAGVTVCF